MEVDLNFSLKEKHRKKRKCIKYSELQEIIWDTLEQEVPSRVGQFINGFLLFLVAISIVIFVIGTEDSLRLLWLDWTLFALEYLIGLVFVVEYFLRLFSCVSCPKYARPVVGRLKFIFSFASLVDIVAVFPLLVVMTWVLISCIGGVCSIDGPIGLLSIRSFVAFRLLRVLRLGKLERHFKSLTLVKDILFRKKNEIFLTITIVFVVLIILSTMMWITEGSNQPEHFGSVIRSFYFITVVLSTIGFGDVVPHTFWGKLTTMIGAVFALSIFALPTSILGSSMMEQIELNSGMRKKAKDRIKKWKEQYRIKKKKKSKTFLSTTKLGPGGLNMLTELIEVEDKVQFGHQLYASNSKRKGNRPIPKLFKENSNKVLPIHEKNTDLLEVTHLPRSNSIDPINPKDTSSQDRISRSKSIGDLIKQANMKEQHAVPQKRMTRSGSIGHLDKVNKVIASTGKQNITCPHCNQVVMVIQYAPPIDEDEFNPDPDKIWNSMRKSRGLVKKHTITSKLRSMGISLSKEEISSLLDEIGVMNDCLSYEQFKKLLRLEK